MKELINNIELCEDCYKRITEYCELFTNDKYRFENLLICKNEIRKNLSILHYTKRELIKKNPAKRQGMKMIDLNRIIEKNQFLSAEIKQRINIRVQHGKEKA
jgi:hypothetical protein